MNVPIGDAVILVCAMGAVIFFCRAFPFIFFQRKGARSGKAAAFLNFAERIAPPAAMTVLAFNALGPHLGSLAKAAAIAEKTSTLPEEFSLGLAALIAAVLTAVTHIWKRNALLSIFGGTAVYMILLKLV